MNKETDDPIGKADTPTKPGSGSKPLSERKLRAQQENAKKSTGPRTERGKSFSRQNSLKHGLLSAAILFDVNGKPIEPGLQELREAMIDEYGCRDLWTCLQIDLAVVDAWHMLQATEMAVQAKQHTDNFLLLEWLPQWQRYNLAFTNSFKKMMASLAKAKRDQEMAKEDGEEAPELVEADPPEPGAGIANLEDTATECDDEIPADIVAKGEDVDETTDEPQPEDATLE